SGRPCKAEPRLQGSPEEQLFTHAGGDRQRGHIASADAGGPGERGQKAARRFQEWRGKQKPRRRRAHEHARDKAHAELLERWPPGHEERGGRPVPEQRDDDRDRREDGLRGEDPSQQLGTLASFSAHTGSSASNIAPSFISVSYHEASVA